MYQKDHALDHKEDIRFILMGHLHQLIRFREASLEEDRTQGFDFAFAMDTKIAVRIREGSFHARDLTIRTNSRFGPPEIKKIREGKGDFYLYCWTRNDRIEEYILVDLDRFRKSGLLEMHWPKMINKQDKNEFICIPGYFLEWFGCLLKKQNHENKSLLQQSSN